MPEFKIVLSRIDSGRSLWKLTMRFPANLKTSLDDVISAISETMAGLNQTIILSSKKTKKK